MTQESKAEKNGPAAVGSLVNPEGTPSGPGETTGSLRTEKTARIREQLRQATYHVSPLDVARAILQSASFCEVSKKKGK